MVTALVVERDQTGGSGRGGGLMVAALNLSSKSSIVCHEVQCEERGNGGNDQQNRSHRQASLQEELGWLKFPDSVFAHPQQQQARSCERCHDDKRHRDVDQDRQ
jgi:hypothetical protein